MSWPNMKIVKRFTSLALFVFFSGVQVQVKAWEVDFSRRQKDLKSLRKPASVVDQKVVVPSPESSLQKALTVLEPAQDVVILQTESGFVPSVVRLRKGGHYQFHLVNVNEKAKNMSFVLDAFSEHHSTFFGHRKTFKVTPQTDGIFSFVSPESGYQGQIVVISENRTPASE